MPGTLQIGRLFGISVRVHFSWAFIFALVAWSLATAYLPQNYPGWTSRVYWAIGLASSALLFVSVLVHEFSHSLVALSRGHQVQSITLFFLGGVSEIKEDSRTAGEEFWVSVVGPITSLVLAVVFGVLFFFAPPANPQLRAVMGYLGVVNAALGIFNLMPAFPLDGGRVLKAIVWKVTGSEPKATAVSSATGSGLGFGLIGLGVVFAFTDQFLTGIWLVLIGWFIHSSASSVRRQRVVETALSGKIVRDAMRHDVPTVAPGTTVAGLVDHYISRDFERAYVVMLGDTCHGLVTVSDVKKVPVGERSRRWITEIMTRATDVKTVHPDDSLETALEALVATGYHQLLVAEDEKPLGLLTRGDVLRVLEIAELFPPQKATA